MTVIWKFHFDRNKDVLIASIPSDAIVRHAAMNQGRFTIWVQLDPNAPKVDRVFHVYGTGWNIVDGDLFVQTFIQEDEHGYDFVWHVFERKN